MSKISDELPRRTKSAGISRNVVICALTAVAAVVFYYSLPQSLNELSRRTMTILLVAAVFWATEVLPLFATSLCIIGLEILFLAHKGGLANVLPSLSPWPLGADGAVLKLSYVEFCSRFPHRSSFCLWGDFCFSAR